MFRLRTWDTQVAGGQVACQVVEARSRLIHLGIGDAQPALAASGALPIQYLDDVRRAADEAEVDAYASPEPHATVACRRYENDSLGRTVRVKAFRRTVIFNTHIGTRISNLAQIRISSSSRRTY